MIRNRTVVHPNIVAVLVIVSGAAGCNGAVPGTPEETAAPFVSVAHAHETPGETCFMCDESKRDPQRLWCNEHGRYEDRCFLCHPEIQDKDRLYCTEHFLYEDECFLCHPQLLEEASMPEPEARAILDGLSPAERSDMPGGLYCYEHDVYESECGICHPELLAALPAGLGLKVRLPSLESARKAGVRVGRPSDIPIPSGMKVLGELTYNKNALAAITPLASGVVLDVHVDVGERVQRGQLLAEVSAPAVAEAKSMLVKALVDAELKRQAHEREQQLREREVSSVQDYEEARAAYAAARSEVDRARQQLLNLGLTDAEVKEIEDSRSTSSILPLRVPFDGTIVDRDAVTGTAVESGMALFHLAKLDTMWLELSIPELEVGRLHPGAKVVAEFDAFPGRSFEGVLTWVSSRIDDATRTVQARATLENADRRLKSGLFGRVVISETSPPDGVTVPVDAIQEVDGRSVVFAKLDEDLFETRVVETGARHGRHQMVTRGLSPNDEIVLTESYVLKSELLKARLGAGCVHQ